VQITEIRVKFANHEADRLKAYCSVTFDEEFVVRDVRIVDGTNGLFVAMPSRKLCTACPRCNHKNPSLAKFCSDCGARVPAQPPTNEAGQRTKLHRDIAHPITPAFRQSLHQAIIEAYQLECERAKDPNYDSEAVESEEPEALEAVVEEVIVEEPAEEEEDDGVTEYDALIADLRRGGGDHGNRRDVVRPQPIRKPVSSDQGDRGRSSQPQRPRNDGPARRPAPAPRPAAPPPRSPSPQAPRPQPPKRTAVPVSSRPEPPRAPQPAPVAAVAKREVVEVREAPVIAKPVPRRPEPAPKPAVRRDPPPVINDDTESESLPFGAGIQ